MSAHLLTKEDQFKGTATFAAQYDDMAIILNYRAVHILMNYAFPQLKSGMQILDLGVGTGLIAEEMVNRGLEVVIDGVDQSEHMLEKARDKGRYRHLVKADLIKLRETVLPEQEYDAVISCGVYGDYVNLKYLVQAMELVKSRGILAVAGRGKFQRTLTKAGIEVLVNEIGYAHNCKVLSTVNYNYWVGVKNNAEAKEILK